MNSCTVMFLDNSMQTSFGLLHPVLCGLYFVFCSKKTKTVIVIQIKKYLNCNDVWKNTSASFFFFEK